MHGRHGFWVAALVLSVLAPPQTAQQGRQHGEPAGKPFWNETHRRWLEEDVLYIISEAECSTFARLTSGEARERFIGQFWARRDPTPGTPRNEFKEEHYRRIAYADDRFRSIRRGSKTDRGRIYIQQGPPDEIESHPAGGTYTPPAGKGGFSSARPFEVWLYRETGTTGADSLVKFIDSDSDGEYSLDAGQQVPETFREPGGCP